MLSSGDPWQQPTEGPTEREMRKEAGGAQLLAGIFSAALVGVVWHGRLVVW